MELIRLNKWIVWVKDHQRENELVNKSTELVIFVEYPHQIRAYRNIHYPKAFAKKVLAKSKLEKNKPQVLGIYSGNMELINGTLWIKGEEKVVWRVEETL